MYHFYPKLLLRSPAYSPASHSATDLQHLLMDPWFQAAVYVASKPLYQALEKKAFRVQALSPRLRFTLLKYRNRMCFRPTPFGLFAGVVPAEWTTLETAPLVVREGAWRARAILDFGETAALAEELLAHELAPYHTYRRNFSLYGKSQGYRFLRYEKDERHRRGFFIDSLPYGRYLQGVLAYCATGRTRAAIVSFLQAGTAASAVDCEAFVAQLIDQQLLESTLGANITGEDYLSRLLGLCRDLHLDTPRTKRINSLLEKLQEIGEEGLGNAGVAICKLSGQFPFIGKERAGLYVNIHQGAAAGGLDREYQRAIQDGLDCLRHLVPVAVPAGLQRFALAFQKKFDNRAIPLLQALDPELGVGYEELASSYGTPELLQGLSFAASEAAEQSVTWTQVHALLLEKWQRSEGKTSTITLKAQDLHELSPDDSAAQMPPSIGVLFRVLGEQVYLEQAGGATATALLGRFTPLQGEIDRIARSIAHYEQTANPHVVFAELVHTCDEHTANIDRRQSFREYEIPVLVQSLMPEEKQVHLSDLWVWVAGGEVVLFSRKLQKVIVPRLGSAFNYKRNTLAAFRFLCDMQYQGLRAGLTLHLANLFPGLGYYPRVTYNKAILHLASWHLRKKQLNAVLEPLGEESRQKLRQLAKELGWPQHVALTAHDHQLVIDLEKEQDLDMLLHEARGKGHVVVQEYPFAATAKAVVTDERGRPRQHQFLASLYREQEVYPERDPVVQSLQAGNERKRKLVPGSGWLYFKLYCHPSRSNQLLGEVLAPTLNKLVKKGEVKKWFFVRYRDLGYHIRLRLCLAPEKAGDVMGVISRKLALHVRNGTIEDLQLAVYERELERYGAGRIEAAEDVFCASSALLVARIRNAELEETGYVSAFAEIDDIAATFSLSLEEKVQLFRQLYESLNNEFRGDKVLREQLSHKFRVISRKGGILPRTGGQAAAPENPWMSHRAHFRATLRAFAQKAGHLPRARYHQVAADLMHMHLNRLCTDQPRKQELVMYYCLWKFYASALARERKP